MPFDDDMVAKNCAGKVATLVSLFGRFRRGNAPIFSCHSCAKRNPLLCYGGTGA